ncbi:MAG: response regulator [Bdellovibrionales bacterium]|nr:response regulator [Bdellovibrionales bacterium]
MRRPLLISTLGVLAVVLGTLPIALMLYMGAPLPLHILAMLNFIAWTTVCLLFVAQTRMLRSIDHAMQTLDLDIIQGGVEEKLGRFLYESKRYHLASYGFMRGPGAVSERDLGINLRRIVDHAYRELDAKAVELALFSQETGLWSQVLIAGEPSSVGSQSMLMDASSDDSSKAKEAENVIVQAMSFAGTLFGKLRIEMPKGRLPSKADRHVTELMATQGALMLVDARFTDALLRMREKGDESVRAKTGFLANLSHEIRGPLGIVLNGAELMLDGLCGPVTESQQDTCRMMKKSAEHLLDLVNDVLDYAKVEAGKIKAKGVNLAVKPLLDDLAAVIRTQAMAKGHSVDVTEIDSSLGMICDKRHARQILINFLTNAVKYTPDGGKITLSAERVPGDRVKIMVTDTGVGIADKEKSKVFGAFERVDNPYSLQQSGTGLGMPLARKLAEVNEGIASFESKEGEGSTFWIMMPACKIRSAEAQVESGDEVKAVPQGNGEAVLLVDQSGEGRDMLERYLNHQGFRIIAASSGADILKTMREAEIDLAVVESDLPGGSGEDMISVIRSNPKAASVPIIMLSSKAFDFDVERFLKLGVDRCLAKPIELGEIAVTVRRLIDEARSFRE